MLVCFARLIFVVELFLLTARGVEPRPTEWVMNIGFLYLDCPLLYMGGGLGFEIRCYG